MPAAAEGLLTSGDRGGAMAQLDRGNHLPCREVTVDRRMVTVLGTPAALGPRLEAVTWRLLRHMHARRPHRRGSPTVDARRLGPEPVRDTPHELAPVPESDDRTHQGGQALDVIPVPRYSSDRPLRWYRSA